MGEYQIINTHIHIIHITKQLRFTQKVRKQRQFGAYVLNIGSMGEVREWCVLFVQGSVIQDSSGNLPVGRQGFASLRNDNEYVFGVTSFVMSHLRLDLGSLWGFGHELGLLLLDAVAIDVFVEGHLLVYDAIGGDLDDAVTHGLYHLVVTRCDDHIATEVCETVVQCGDGLKVQVIGRFVEDEHIGTHEHHTREHTAHLLSSREDVALLEHLLS